MSPNGYANTMLTIIAGSLLWLCFAGSWRIAPVEAEVTSRVTIVGAEKPLPVGLVSVGGKQLDWVQPAVPVDIKFLGSLTALPVRIISEGGEKK